MKMPKKLLGEWKFEGKSHAGTKGVGGGAFPDIDIRLMPREQSRSTR